VLEPPSKISSPYKELIQKLERDHVWSVDLSTVQSNHPLKKMQDLVDHIMEEMNFDVPLVAIWEKLQEPPFGLMPSPIGLFLFACVMSKYAKGYYIYDGSTTQELNPNIEADILTRVVKNDKGCENLVIKRLTKDAQDFCLAMRETFNLTEAQSMTPEEVRKSLNVKINEMHYPLWILEFDTGPCCGSETFHSLISGLQAFIFSDEVPNDEQLRSITQILNGPSGTYLAKNFTRDHMSQCFVQFLNDKDRDITSCMQRLNLDANGVRDILRYLLKEDASRWNQEEVISRLNLLKISLLSMEALNAICVSRITRLDEMASTFEARFSNRFSFELYQKACDTEGLEELSNAFGVLQEILRLPENLSREDALKITESDIELVIRNASDLRTYLDNPSILIKVLASMWEDQELDERAAKEVLEKMLKMLDKTALKDLPEEKVHDLIHKVIGDLTKNKLSALVQEKLRSLPVTLTVENWEEKYKMPILWALNDDALKDCIKDMRALYSLDEDRLGHILNILEEKSMDFSKLSDENYLLSKYAAMVMPDYAEAISDQNSISQLKDYIYGKMESRKPAEWTEAISTIQRFAKEWLQRRYKDAVARNLQQRLMQIRGAELKSLIESEIQNNSDLGLALYECLRRREGVQSD
jgi:hypothetical protein